MIEKCAYLPVMNPSRTRNRLHTGSWSSERFANVLV